LIFDLHSHTKASFDGFTTADELRRSCLRRGISMVAVTEHDAPCAVDPGPFSADGVVLVPGCEFTTDRGAHVLGLFVSRVLPKGATREAVFEHIRAEGGLIVLPHPYKPGSGYFDFYPEDDLLQHVTFVEMLNGGWDSSEFVEKIRALCARHDLRMIASSDSHKAEQVGLCATRVPMDASEARVDPRAFLAALRQEQIELLIDEEQLRRRGRVIRSWQKTGAYQFLLHLVPPAVRRGIKRAAHGLRTPPEIAPAAYRRFPA
jgi:predicted metal-dependent phosphoesterase TrpH